MSKSSEISRKTQTIIGSEQVIRDIQDTNKQWEEMNKSLKESQK